MSRDQWKEIREIFLQALERPQEERRAFLDEACAGREEIRAEVEAMLASEADTSGLSIEDKFLGDRGEDSVNLPSLAGERVGFYQLGELVGRGGMGEVYRAERIDGAFSQDVALKVVKPGIQTVDLMKRFQVERQILARLEHPNIGRLIDGGQMPDGRSYLVMEFVDGIPINDYCDLNKLSIRARLELFQTVCKAIHFAHRNLIVHRDLKPTNILVTEEGEVKLLDFGIAKLLDADSVDLSIPLTRSGMRIMTPEYAAPEQVTGGVITTTTDVYALGVLLYELLTGCRPHHFNGGGVSEIERVICHELPPRPSTILKQGAEFEKRCKSDPHKTAENRSTAPGALQRIMVGDLDTLILKAMHKDVGRRYESADALREDIGRYLQGLPIVARPDTLGYRMRKFVGRHKVPVFAAATLLVLVLVFTMAITFQATRIATQAEAIAEERDRAETVSSFLMDLYRGADPNEVVVEEQNIAAEMLASGASQIRQQLADQPDVQIRLFEVLSISYENLGRYPEANEMAEAALDAAYQAYQPPHFEIGRMLNRVAQTVYLQGKMSQAMEAAQEALTMLQVSQDEERPVPELGDSKVLLAKVARSTLSYSREEGLELIDEAISIYQNSLVDQDARITEALSIKADILMGMRLLVEGKKVATEVVERYRASKGDHPSLAWALTTLGTINLFAEEFDESKQNLREAEQIYLSRYGEDHPDLSRTTFFIAELEKERGNLDEAMAIAQKTYEIRVDRLGMNHSATTGPMGQIGEIAMLQGNYDLAEKMLLQAYETRLKIHGRVNQRTMRFLRRLVALYAQTGEYGKEAEYRARLQEFLPENRRRRQILNDSL